jgi:hypothetical protein
MKDVGTLRAICLAYTFLGIGVFGSMSVGGWMGWSEGAASAFMVFNLLMLGGAVGGDG